MLATRAVDNRKKGEPAARERLTLAAGFEL